MKGLLLKSVMLTGDGASVMVDGITCDVFHVCRNGFNVDGSSVGSVSGSVHVKDGVS